MDFSEALKAPTIADRDKLIRAQVDDEDFSDMLDGEHMRYGGFPDDVSIDRVTIFDRDSGTIVVTVDITFSESVPSNCKDINYEHPGTAEFRLFIDKATGEGEFEDPTVSIGMPGDSVDIDDDDEFDIEVFEDDYQ